MSTPTTVVTRRGRDLVAPKLFNRLSARLAADHLVDREYAERVIDQSLAFLAACGTDLETPHRPSHTVDMGWHTFLLHTKEYSLFCRQIAGHFIHHVPDDTPPNLTTAPTRHASTITFIEQAGYVVDHELWLTSARCDPDECSASGRDGDENKDGRIPR
ncbi:glycine-rich domain-containing protein [Frankia sp. CiP1_Cm_nod2]|uniref:glycine-rich domain-containing protein n=1 Tax=Frankia sp. CiP1_Cm_nod2 TaxID=2897161 RepID=UPI002024E650